MADRSHLTPVTTTDKRGRTTTVYRNLRGRGAPGGSRGLPAPASPAGTAPKGPTEQEVADPIDPHGAAVKDLALSLIKSDALPEQDVYEILYSAVEAGGSLLALDSLRIAAHLSPRWPERTRAWRSHIVVPCGAAG